MPKLIELLAVTSLLAAVCSGCIYVDETGPDDHGDWGDGDICTDDSGCFDDDWDDWDDHDHDHTPPTAPEAPGVGGDCADDAGCEPPACVLNSDCSAGDYCVNGACLDTCAADTDCATGEVCDLGVCNVGLCLPDPDGGGECLYHADCDGGVCQNGYCFERCSADADCADGEVCDAGSCRNDDRPQPQCLVNADCAEDEVCSDAKCRANCTCDEDCGGGAGEFVCDAGACLPTSESAPECVSAADCVGLNCVDGACR